MLRGLCDVSGIASKFLYIIFVQWKFSTLYQG